MLTFWFALSTAWALPPDATPALLDVGEGIVGDLNVSYWGDVLVGVARGDDKAFLVNVEDWSTQPIDAPCATVTSVALVDFDFPNLAEIWVGCSDGVAHSFFWDGVRVSPTVIDAVNLTADVGVSIDGLWYSETNGYLYALYDGPSGGNEIRRFDYITGEVDASFIITTVWTNFSEGQLSWDDDTLFLYHEGDNVTQVGLTAGTAVASSPGGVVSSLNDIFLSYSGTLYGVSKANDSLVEYDSIQRDWLPIFTGLNNPQCVVASYEEGEWWMSITGEDVRTWETEVDSGYPVSTVDEPYFLGGDNNEIRDGVVYDAYFYGGGSGGRLHINTANPWVEPASVTVTPDATFTEGETVTFGFTATEPGSWMVTLGGDRYGLTDGAFSDTDAVNIASGTATTVGEIITTDLVVGADWPEGSTYLYVLLTGDDGQTGHARGAVSVDNPPDPPALTSANINFADGGLVLSFDGIKDEDLSHYEIYVTTLPFDGSDYATGGPAYDGTTDIEAPLIQDAYGGESVNYDIRPLENGVRHYVGVRAIDDGGKVGPISNVISDIPRQVYSAAELAGEKGGPVCSTTPSAAGWLAIGMAGLMIRRRNLGTAAAALISLGLLAAPSAQAAELEKDLTPQRGDIEIRYGGMYLTDPIITSVYDETASNILQLEFGPQLYQMFEVDFGVGFFQELAHKVDSTGADSDQRAMLTWWPSLALDGTFRLHIIDEQLLVPYIRGGFDYVVWSEKTDSADGSGKEVIRGSKFGNHAGVGLNLLLDPFAKRRASLLEAQTGINDTYLTFEWRRQRIDDRRFPWAVPSKNVKGLDFSGSMFTIGIKLDY
ncbi:MAG: hypothetical protein GWP91_12790 [Rhodobacterales bacterium]|nr:hypothetical protein [Rhodobacterales bacterium]